MQKRSSTTKSGNKTVKRGQGTPDPNVKAFNIVQMVTGQMDMPAAPKKNEAAVTLGRLGGLKGGAARATKLTPERRKEIAQAAAAKRWGK